MINNIKRFVAERFLEDILDEDFLMGIREGRTRGLRADIMYLENIIKGENKTNAKGLQVAIDALRRLDNANANNSVD
jgi:hypothetical protein